MELIMSAKGELWKSHRGTLLERLAQLTDRNTAMSQHLRGEDGRHDSDFGDRANFTSNDEVLEGLEDVGLAEITLIRAAVQRIELGTYDECVACGGSIGAGRLSALPHARMCIACAAAAQR